MWGSKRARGAAFETAEPASRAGMDPRRLAKAVELFRAQQRAGLFPGGQLVVRRHGRVVADVAVGVAKGVRPGEGPAVPVTSRTPFLVFSAGKPLLALVIARLEERGLLDVEAPIVERWPEFGRHGKQHITTLDVLTHTGGVLNHALVERDDLWTNWDEVVASTEAVRPTYRRGVLAYHPLEYGWILAEVVRRATGLPFVEVLRRELTGPAGLLGLRFGVSPDEAAEVANTYWLGPERVLLGGHDVGARFERIANDLRFRSAFLPGGGLITTAASLAALYDFLIAGGIAAGGRKVLEPATVRRYTRRHVMGWDRSTRAPLAVGRGFLLGMLIPSAYGWWNSAACYGHAGLFSTVAFADPRSGLAVAVVTNANRGARDLVQRFVPLATAIRGAVL